MMEQYIKINFSKEEINSLGNYMHFLNTVEKRNYNLKDLFNDGLPKDDWQIILQYLNKSHTLVHPNMDGSSTTHDLTSVKNKISKSVQ
jgi:hypothetical protein